MKIMNYNFSVQFFNAPHNKIRGHARRITNLKLQFCDVISRGFCSGTCFPIRYFSLKRKLFIKISQQQHTKKKNTLKVIYKGFFKSFIVLYADRICPEHHFVENRIENFPSV